MNATRTGTWCVCGQESQNDPWETLADGLDSREAADEWLRENHHRFDSHDGFYVDLEEHDGHADTYFERNPDGSLSRFNGCEMVYFAD